MKKNFRILFCLVIVLALALCVLTACDKNAQNQESNSTNVNPPFGEGNEPSQEEEKYVSINAVWNECFKGTTFVDDLQVAYGAICEKALPDLDVEIKEINYNSLTNRISLTVSYYEYDATRTGTIEFDAPSIQNQLEDNGVKSVILNLAEYLPTAQIKESDVESAKTKIANSIERVRTTIEEEFSALQKEDLIVEKEEIVFTTYGEIYDEYYSDLTFDEDIKSGLQLRNGMSNTRAIILIWYHIDKSGQTIKYRADGAEFGSYNNGKVGTNAYSRRSWLLVINNVPQIILDAATDVKVLVFDYVGLSEQTKMPVNKISEAISIIDSAIMNIKKTIIDAFVAIDSKSMRQVSTSDVSVFGSAMDQTKEMETARKLLPDKEILSCYVEAPYGSDNGSFDPDGFDNDHFKPTTGYIKSFNVDILYKEDNSVMRYHAKIVLPYYTDLHYTDYWDSFLKGTATSTGNTRYRYLVWNETSAFECDVDDWIGAVEHSAEIIEEDCSYIILNDKAYLLSLKTGKIESYSMPSELGGKEVAGSGGLTFANSNIINFEVPETVKYLMTCPSNIESIKLSSEIKVISRVAFSSCSKLTTIYYDGTIEQWHAIIKDAEWDKNTGDYVVVCSDGTLTKEQANNFKNLLLQTDF